MGACEIFRLEATRIEQGHGQRIAQRQLRRGAGRWRQIQRTGLFFHPTVERQIGMAGQRRIRVAGHRNQWDTLALEYGQDGRQLVRLSAVGDRQHQVGGLDHAQITMAGFGRVHEHGGCPGRGQRRRHLAADVPALAHPHDHDAPLHPQHQRHGLGKGFADTPFQAEHGGGFDLQRVAGELLRPVGIEGRILGFLGGHVRILSGASALASIRV